MSAGTPGVPFGSMQGSGLSKKCDGCLARRLVARRMRVGELLPVSGRTTPRKRPGKRMALGARVAQAAARQVGFVVDSALRVVPYRPGFLRRQPMLGAEVFD